MNIFFFEVDHFLRGVDIELFSGTLSKTARERDKWRKKVIIIIIKMPKQTTAELET